MNNKTIERFRVLREPWPQDKADILAVLEAARDFAKANAISGGGYRAYQDSLAALLALIDLGSTE